MSRRTLLERAAAMRKNPPEPERRIWRYLRNSRMGGHKFHRQAVIGNRIVDFFCPAKGLIVEIDGETHNAGRDRIADERMLADFGFSTVRFSNDEVVHNLDGVLQALGAALDDAEERWPDRAITTPQPPPLKRRGSHVSEALRAAADRLAATSATARLDAELLMAEALGMARSDMLLRGAELVVPPGFEALVARRAACEPVAHILGRQEFYGRDFAVTPDVLIPRADSETVIEAALGRMGATGSILDLGTGSGALLLTLLAEKPGWHGVGLDRSEAALAMAARNARALGLERRAELRLADWTRRDWCAGLGHFDLVVANPPYVENDAELEPDVRDFEPAGALFAGRDGLDDYRRLVPQLRGLLRSEGFAVFEIGSRQDAAVSALALAHGFTPHLRRDLANRPRAVICT